MTYTLLPGGGVRRFDGSAIPPDPSNQDWQSYLAWLATGNQPDPAPTDRPAPRDPSLTALLGLLQAKGILSAADAASLRFSSTVLT